MALNRPYYWGFPYGSRMDYGCRTFCGAGCDAQRISDAGRDFDGGPWLLPMVENVGTRRFLMPWAEVRATPTSHNAGLTRPSTRMGYPCRWPDSLGP